MDNIITVFRLSQRLMRGNRGRLYFLLATFMIFHIEVAMMMPLILKYSFQAVTESDMDALIKAAVCGICVFAFNFAVMYFINVYGDAWATKFSFHAVENSFKEFAELPVASLQAMHNDDDLFNRQAAGTGNIVGFYFSLAGLLGNGAAVVVLMIMLYRFSSMLGMFIILLVAAELVIVRLQFCYNADYSRKLQKDKAACIRRIRCLLEQLSFHQHNRTWDWMRGLYEEDRQQWFCTQERKAMANVFLDSCLVGMHGFFRMGLVYNFMVQKEVFSAYVEDVASSFSTFHNLVDKTKGFGSGVSGLPNSFVPIGKLEEILIGKTEHGGETKDGYLALDHISVFMGDREIVKDICCCIPLGSKVAVIGENGSGKSTFLKVLAGLCWCGEKRVYHSGRKTAYIPADELLFQEHSVLDNILYSREDTGIDEVGMQLKELHFSDVEKFCGKVPAELSGGEAKRVNIARGLLSDAEVILVDEPTSCLDRETSGYVVKKLLSLEGKTVIYITHDPEFAVMADEVILMQEGEIRQTMKGSECADNAYFRDWSSEG